MNQNGAEPRAILHQEIWPETASGQKRRRAAVNAAYGYA